MASREQGSRRNNSRSEESRLLRPSFPPLSTSSPLHTEKQELDERLAAFEATAQLQQKRHRIEALKRDKDPNKPTDSKRRSTSLQRYKNNA